MKIKVKLFGIPALPSHLEGGREVQVDFAGEKLIDLIHCIYEIELKKKGVILNDKGEIPSELFVLINGEIVPGLNRLSRRIKEGDLVELVLAGG